MTAWVLATTASSVFAALFVLGMAAALIWGARWLLRNDRRR